MEDLAPVSLDLNCQTQYRCLKEGIQCHPRMEELLHLKRTDPSCAMSPSSHNCHIAKNQDDLLQLLGMHCWWCQKTWKSQFRLNSTGELPAAAGKNVDGPGMSKAFPSAETKLQCESGTADSTLVPDTERKSGTVDTTVVPDTECSFIPHPPHQQTLGTSQHESSPSSGVGAWARWMAQMWQRNWRWQWNWRWHSDGG